MGFQKVEFEFPDEKEDILKIEKSSAEEIDLSGKKKVESDELEVEVVDDTPEEDRGRKPSEPPEEVTEDELENYSEKVRKRIQHFTKGYHDERRAKEQALREREELERLAQKLVEENKKLKGSMNKNEEALVSQAKRLAETEYQTAKNAYKQAYDSGNSDEVLEAQESLTTAKLKLDRLSSYKPKKAEEDKEEPVKAEQPISEPVKQNPVQPDQKAVTWAQENPWFGSDDEMTSFALGYHNKLVKQGMDPTSNEYYEKINSRMREVFPNEFEYETPRSSKPANVVAPATRSKAPKKVRLTQTQVAIAKRLGVPLEEYAKQVAEEMRKQR